jgi:hypothetical protein
MTLLRERLRLQFGILDIFVFTILLKKKKIFKDFHILSPTIMYFFSPDFVSELVSTVHSRQIFLLGEPALRVKQESCLGIWTIEAHNSTTISSPLLLWASGPLPLYVYLSTYFHFINCWGTI